MWPEMCHNPRVRAAYARLLQQDRCTGIGHLRTELARIESLGGEGRMLRQPRSQYETGRSSTPLTIKSMHDSEGGVVEHLPGRGRHAGRLVRWSSNCPAA